MGGAEDGTSRRLSLEHATQNFYLVGLVTACRYPALSGTASVEFALNKLFVNIYSGRHAVNDTANSRTMTLAKGCEGEKCSKRVTHSNILL